jgi:hypothetical protein
LVPRRGEAALEMRHKDKTEIVDGVAGNARITGMV